jgi:hypothetical protein
MYHIHQNPITDKDMAVFRFIMLFIKMNPQYDWYIPIRLRINTLCFIIFLPSGKPRLNATASLLAGTYLICIKAGHLIHSSLPIVLTCSCAHAQTSVKLLEIEGSFTERSYGGVLQAQHQR